MIKRFLRAIAHVWRLRTSKAQEEEMERRKRIKFWDDRHHSEWVKALQYIDDGRFDEADQCAKRMELYHRRFVAEVTNRYTAGKGK